MTGETYWMKVAKNLPLGLKPVFMMACGTIVMLTALGMSLVGLKDPYTLFGLGMLGWCMGIIFQLSDLGFAMYKAGEADE